MRRRRPDAGSDRMMASDDKTGVRLWTLRVYEVVIDPAEETDVHERCFKTMTRIAGRRALLFVNERGAGFEVDFDARQVTPAH